MSVAPTTSPTLPRAFHRSEARPATASNSASPPSPPPPTARVCRSFELGFDVLHSTHAPRAASCVNGVTESAPMYPFTVTDAAEPAPQVRHAALA